MEEKMAREELKIWGEKPRIREPKKEKLPMKMRILLFFEGFIKRNAIAMLVIAALALEGWAVAIYTEKRVTKEVTASVTAELRQGFQKYLDEMEEQSEDSENNRMASELLTDEKSLAEAMDRESDAIAKLLYGYRNNSVQDRKTLIWCVLMRTGHSKYPGTVEAVVNQKEQWMFYSDQNPVRPDDKEMAMEQLKEWHDKKYPAGLSDDFLYAEWSQTRIRLFDNYEDKSERNYWRYPE